MYRLEFIAPYWEYVVKDINDPLEANDIVCDIKRYIAHSLEIAQWNVEVSDYIVYEDGNGHKYFDCAIQVADYYIVQVHYYYE